MYTTIRWQQRFQNFERAFLVLKEAISRVKSAPDDQILIAGLIQTYEFTLELGWKMTKDFLQESGHSVSGPKMVMKQAVEDGIIKNGRVWMEAIDHRNETSHAYNQKIAKEVTEKILQQYFLMLQELYEDFKKKLKE